MLMGMMNALALGSIALFLCAAFRRRIEETLPAALGCWMFLLLLLAVFRRLLWIDAVSAGIVVLSAALLAAGFGTGRLTLATCAAFLRRQVLTPGLMAAAILGLLFLVGCSAREVAHPDEIQYWGTFTRSLWVSGGFVDPLRHCTPLHAAYAPGMQLLQWSVMHMAGGWHESLMYSTLFFFNASFLLPLLAGVPWRQWWKALLFVELVMVVPTCLSGSYYALLSTDSALGMLFGLSLVLLARGRAGGFEKLLLAAALGGMVMVKDSGVGPVMLAGLFLPLAQPKGCRKAWLPAFAAPVVCVALWKGYCAVNGLAGTAAGELASAASAVAKGSWVVPEDFARVTAIFLRQLATVPGNQAGWWGGWVPLAGLPTLLWFLLPSALPLLLWHKHAPAGSGAEGAQTAVLAVPPVIRWRLALFPLLALLFYIASMLFTFLAVFPAELPFYDAGNIPLLERYGSVYPIGLFLLAAQWLRGARLPRQGTVAISLVALACVLCFANWNHLQNFIPSVYRQRFPDHVQADRLRQESWLKALEDPAQTRILNLTDAQVDTRMYALPPISFVGMPPGAGGAPASLSQLRQYLVEQGVTHLRVEMGDSARLTSYGNQFGIPLENGALYRLGWEQGTPVFQKVFP